MSSSADLHPARGLLAVSRIIVPRSVADELQHFMREAGEIGYEAVGFWVGTQDGDTFLVRQPLIPRQQAVRTPEDEVAVIIPGEELFHMNVSLYKRGLTLVAQIHSHPAEAYHSETDNRYPVVTQIGGLSIVVPDFATQPFALARAAVHRLRSDGTWYRLPPGEVEALLRIVEF